MNQNYKIYRISV